MAPASRFNRKDKQRKVNKIYNISIAVVSILIVIVAITIFFGKSAVPKTETASSKTDSVKQSEENKKESSNGNEQEEEAFSTTEEEQTTGTTEEELSESEKNAAKADSGEQKAAEVDLAEGEAGKPKVGEPVGTSQTGKHTTSFEKGSADWNEMTQALASGTGLDPANMTILWLGNGGAPNKAVGTVSAKNDPKKYKVYLEWVDGAGWKPVKVE